jgi:hypothetical protein
LRLLSLWLIALNFNNTMAQPIQYFQIFYFASDETIHPLNTKAFGEPDPYFGTYEEAGDFINEHALNSQSPELGSEKRDTTLVILPVWPVRFNNTTHF